MTNQHTNFGSFRLRLLFVEKRPSVVLLVFLVILGCHSQIEAGKAKVGTVDHMEDARVWILLDAGVSVSAGARLEAINYDTCSVAVLRVIGDSPINSNQMICKVIRGSSDIRPGFSVVTRTGLGWSMSAEATSFPVEISSPQGPTVSERGKCFAITACVDPSIMEKGKKHGPGYPLVGTAVIDFRSFWAWEVAHLGYMMRVEVLPEFLQVQFGGLAGLMLGVSNISWQTPEGVSYDSLGTSGKARPGVFWSYRGFAGLSYQLSRRIRPYARAVYFGYTTPKYSDVDSYDQATGKHYIIEEQFLSKRTRKAGNISYQVGIEFWFNP